MSPNFSPPYLSCQQLLFIMNSFEEAVIIEELLVEADLDTEANNFEIEA